MNRTFISIIFYSCFAIFSFGQGNTFDPPKKVNAIIIEKKSPSLDFLLDYARHLQEFGFSIEKLDRDLVSLSTDFKTYEFAGVAVVKIIAYAKQNGDTSSIEIRGKVEVTNPMAGGPVPFEACNCGMVGDARKNAFNDILRTLRDFKFDSLEFIIK
jgi:hypothetical protein